jgi:hypothetical protein
MIPHNPYVFAILTVILAVVPVLQATDPSIALPPVALLVIAAVNVACATLLKLMAPTVPAQPQGTEVDQLIDRLEALPKDARDELSSRLEWRARLRGEAD